MSDKLQWPLSFRLRNGRTNGTYLTWNVSEVHREAADAIDRLETERDKARVALAEAIELVESWAAYASDYFREKHDLAGDLARLREALESES